jgi:glucose-6-phosphate isomerase
MELPDEAIVYDYRGVLVPPGEEWTPAAEMRARHFLAPGRLKEMVPRLLQCRSQVAAEREMRSVPLEMQPLEPAFIDLPQTLLDQHRRKGDASELGRTLALAGKLRDQADRVVVLGQGGACLAARALFEALRSAYHNELPAEARLGVPRVYFAGDSGDNDALQDLLDLLQITCVDPESREERWAVVSVGTTVPTLDPAVALRVFRREAVEYYGLRSPWNTQLFAAVAGAAGPLRELFAAHGHDETTILTVPDNVGERFAAFTPSGLLPAALAGLDVRALLLGAAAMTRRFLEEPFERNPVLQMVAVNHLAYEELHKPVRVLAVWSQKLEGVGRFYDRLVTESLGKQGRGPTPLTVVQTRELYARGQHLQEGPRDQLVNNLVLHHPRGVPIQVQMADHNEDELNVYARKTLPDLTAAAHRAAAEACFAAARPSADLVVPTLSEHTLGQLLQLLMLATVVEGRLMGLNPYSHPGADSAHRRLHAALRADADDEPGEHP